MWRSRYVAQRLGRGLLVAVAMVLGGCAGAPPAPRDAESAKPTAAAHASGECPKVEVCFAAAKDAMAAGDVAEARTRLASIRREWPHTLWAGRAAFVLARLEVDRDPDAGITWALKASAELPVVAAHALAVAADAAQRSGRPAQAAGYLHELVRRHPESSLVPTALWSAADLWASLNGRQGEAVAALASLAADFPSDPRAPAALGRIVSIGGASGRREEAALACRRLLVDFAASPEAVAVAEPCRRLVADDGAPLTFAERRRRAEGFTRGAKFSDALDVWKELQGAAPTASSQRDIELQVGITLYRLRRWDDAWRAFRRLAASDATPELREEARLWEGRAAFRRDDDRALRQAEAALATAFPESPRRLELISLRAASHRFARATDAAVAAYRELAFTAAELRRPEKAVEAYWNIGWIEYRRGRSAEAREALAQGLALAAPSDAQVPQLLYWISRIDRTQESGEARPDFEQALATRFPFTYYGLLARRGPGGTGDPAGPAVEPIDGTTMPDFTASARAAELVLLGWRDAARDELLLATRRSPPGSDRAAEVADALAALGADDEALRVVRRYFAPALERGDAALRPSVWRRAYPGHLLAAIHTRAEDRVDPFLVAGLIREESVYDSRALSPVGAIGLMQLMPETGRRVARQVGLSDFAVEQLYTPEVNLTLGVRYLGDLLERFAGNEAYAVAAYNAGPEAVTKWLETGPPRSIEEFIEEIPFTETRGYVKRVLRSAWLYRALYGASVDQVVRVAR